MAEDRIHFYREIGGFISGAMLIYSILGTGSISSGGGGAIGGGDEDGGKQGNNPMIDFTGPGGFPNIDFTSVVPTLRKLITEGSSSVRSGFVSYVLGNWELILPFAQGLIINWAAGNNPNLAQNVINVANIIPEAQRQNIRRILNLEPEWERPPATNAPTVAPEEKGKEELEIKPSPFVIGEEGIKFINVRGIFEKYEKQPEKQLSKEKLISMIREINRDIELLKKYMNDQLNRALHAENFNIGELQKLTGSNLTDIHRLYAIYLEQQINFLQKLVIDYQSQLSGQYRQATTVIDENLREQLEEEEKQKRIREKIEEEEKQKKQEEQRQKNIIKKTVTGQEVSESVTFGSSGSLGVHIAPPPKKTNLTNRLENTPLQLKTIRTLALSKRIRQVYDLNMSPELLEFLNSMSNVLDNQAEIFGTFRTQDIEQEQYSLLLLGDEIEVGNEILNLMSLLTKLFFKVFKSGPSISNIKKSTGFTRRLGLLLIILSEIITFIYHNEIIHLQRVATRIYRNNNQDIEFTNTVIDVALIQEGTQGEINFIDAYRQQENLITDLNSLSSNLLISDYRVMFELISPHMEQEIPGIMAAFPDIGRRSLFQKKLISIFVFWIRINPKFKDDLFEESQDIEDF